MQLEKEKLYHKCHILTMTMTMTMTIFIHTSITNTV